MSDSRPYDERPAARPAIVVTEREQQVAARTPRGRFGCASIIATIAIAAIAGGLLAGLNIPEKTGSTDDQIKTPIQSSKTIVGSDTISQPCDEAAKLSVIGTQAIYAKEGAMLDLVGADGIRTAEEDVAVMELLAVTRTEYVEVSAPTFDSCITASEWIGVAQRYPAFVGLTDSSAVADDTLQLYCRDFLSSPACLDALARGIEMLPPPTP